MRPMRPLRFCSVDQTPQRNAGAVRSRAQGAPAGVAALAIGQVTAERRRRQGVLGPRPQPLADCLRSEVRKRVALGTSPLRLAVRRPGPIARFQCAEEIPCRPFVAAAPRVQPRIEHCPRLVVGAFDVDDRGDVGVGAGDAGNLEHAPHHRRGPAV